MIPQNGHFALMAGAGVALVALGGRAAGRRAERAAEGWRWRRGGAQFALIATAFA